MSESKGNNLIFRSQMAGLPEKVTSGRKFRVKEFEL
jgi:hypothetical protein